MGSKLGVMKVAAARLGVSIDEYIANISAGLKHCRKCMQWLPVDAFYVDKSRGDGHKAVCQSCDYEPATGKPGTAERRRMKATGFSWCRMCAKWLPCPEVSRLGLCKPHALEDERRRYANDPDFRFRRIQHSTSRKRGVEPIPKLGRDCLLESFDGLCAYCQDPFESWDHMNPVSKGGETEPGNIVPACSFCNSSKRDMPFDEWMSVAKNPHPSLAGVIELAVMKNG